MVQSSLFRRRPVSDLSRALQAQLMDRGWVTRAMLARELHVSIREIRDAAQHAGGAILSSQQGLKLTVLATSAEKDEALGRFRSQIAQMTKRVVETEKAWHAGGR